MVKHWCMRKFQLKNLLVLVRDKNKELGNPKWSEDIPTGPRICIIQLGKYFPRIIPGRKTKSKYANRVIPGQFRFAVSLFSFIQCPVPWMFLTRKRSVSLKKGFFWYHSNVCFLSVIKSVFFSRDHIQTLQGATSTLLHVPSSYLISILVIQSAWVLLKSTSTTPCPDTSWPLHVLHPC